MMFRVYYGPDNYQDYSDPREVRDRWGVQGVVFDDPVGRQDPYDIGRYTLCQFDYYLYSVSQDTWLGLRAESDLMDWLFNRFNDIGCVLKGRIMNSADWKKLWEEMKQADGFAEKSSSQPEVERGDY